MRVQGVLVAFFPTRESGQLARSELGHRRLRKTALIHRTSGQNTVYEDIHPFYRLGFGIFAGVLFSVLSVLVSSFSFLYSIITAVVFLYVGIGIGSVLAPILIRNLSLCVPRSVLQRFARTLVVDETAVVVMAAPVSMGRAIKIIRQFSKEQPSIFAFHPGREKPIPVRERSPWELLTASKIKGHARKLAEGHSKAGSRSGKVMLLKYLEEIEGVVEQVYGTLAESSYLEQSITTSAEWILDNTIIIRGHIDEVRKNLPLKFLRELPVLVEGSKKEKPRAYELALELVAHNDSQLDRHNILDFLDAYQSVTVLSTGELWALPNLLRIALIDDLSRLMDRVERRIRESEIADYWANRLMVTAHRNPDQIFTVLADLALEITAPSVNFSLQLLDHLYDEEAVLTLVQGWLARKFGGSLENQLLEEKALQAADEVSLGNGISSLRWLRQIDWREIFELQSHVDRILRKDPSGTYSRMDFDTRDSYRHAVEELSKSGQLEEVDVAKAAVNMASGSRKGGSGDPLMVHLGYYLIGDGRQGLVSFLKVPEQKRRKRLSWIYRNHVYLYLVPFIAISGTISIFLLKLSLSEGHGFLVGGTLAVLGFLPGSQLALQLINYSITRLMPPRKLPRMSFKRMGIPDLYRTLVVVPVLMSSRESVREDMENLEIRFQANPDPNLVFALFYDYKDSSTRSTPQDEKLLEYAVASVKELDKKYGPHRFYLLHREREWAETELCWMGWERKRGKLEDLNRFLVGAPARNDIDIVRFGDPDRLRSVRFVITLDRDTQLPARTARRLVETMAHPLNQPVVDAELGVVTKGFTIIQPRVSTSLPSATATGFSRIFTDPVGSDPYTTAVSDVYQDLVGEGSYHGKGIYDPRVFHQVLTDRFPEGRLLSHDLVEGAYVRVGLASDIELFDEFPGDYASYTTREHRWICGDWQIASWIHGRIPQGTKGRTGNPLTIMNRWKIFDNLRRSLVLPGSVVLLSVAWISSVRISIFVSALILLVLFSPPLFTLVTWTTSRKEGRRAALSTFRRDVARSAAEAVLMVHRSGTAFDAIITVFWRLKISRKGLLKWTTAQAAEGKYTGRYGPLTVQVFLGISLVAVLGVASSVAGPVNLLVSVPFLLLWLSTPLFLWYLVKVPDSFLFVPGKADTIKLREFARRTWRTFDEFVGSHTNWLPSDNYQLSHVDELAPRTSPTNIGLYLLSILAAWDFGYLSGVDALHRTSETVTTLENLEKYEGHLLNWYDLTNLTPLKPRYVSTVDSGNLLASLWTLEQGIKEFADEPLLDTRIFQGLADTLRILLGEMERAGLGGDERRHAATLENLLMYQPENLGSAISLLQRSREPAGELADSLERKAGTPDDFPGSRRESERSLNEAAYWARQVERQISSCLQAVDIFIPFVKDMHGMAPEEQSAFMDEEELAALKSLVAAPSLRRLARDGWNSLVGSDAAKKGSNRRLPENIKYSVAAAAWQAWEILDEIDTLVERIQELGRQMNFRFLYHSRRRLFHIGFNINDQKLDGSFYDMFASEARLASFVTIARGDIPGEHWHSLARPYGTVGKNKVLLSWSGTMFEYLMPLLLQRSFRNSMMDKACREAIHVQIRYGQQRGVPWGISESAYADLDASRIYQYKAFGVPGLGLKRGLEEDLVVAPYATFLALGLEPEKALENLKHLVESGLYGDYGFFESIDFSRKRERKGERGVVIRTFMAHHQAMAFLALDNLLNQKIMQRRFHSDVRVKAAEPLLYERIPVHPPIYRLPERQEDPSGVVPAEIIPSESKFDTPHTPRPKTQLLSNGDYSILLTAAGGGWSRWRGLDLTRWRADSTRDHWGTFCYIKEKESGRLWSSSWHPVGGKPDNYVASMTIDRAEIRRSDMGIETESEIIVCPEDDAEIRQITLVNRSGNNVDLEITSYVELAMTPHGADLMHPAFHKLFVRTEYLEEEGFLIAHRRKRDIEEQPVWAGHNIIFDSVTEEPFQWETDRRTFLGRGRSPARPDALGRQLNGTTGMVLDPIFSLRKAVKLNAGQRLSFTVFLCAAPTRGEVLDILRKYSDKRAIIRELELTWRGAQLELRHLRIQPEEARRFQHIASYMIYPSAKLRTTEDRIVQNRLGQSRLWAYGISGDLPIIVITIGDSKDMGLVAEVLHAHTYWRRHGLMADLVILNEESTSYEQPLYSQLFRLVSGSSPYTGMDRPGGVYLLNMDQIAREDVNLILVAARIVLVAARGPLVQQLGRPLVFNELPRKETPEKQVKEKPPAALEQLDLIFKNGYGGFTVDGREYVVNLEEELPPMPWVNVMSTPHFGSMVSEAGSGFTWWGNSQRNRLTGWSNDPVSDPPGEAVYIRDEQSGIYWTPTLQPAGGDGPCRVRHGAGYTVFEHNCNGIEQDLTVFVPMENGVGDPVRVQLLRLRNDSNRARQLSVTFYLEWVLGDDRELTQAHIVTSWDKISRTLMARNRYHPDFPDRVAFAAVSPRPDSCTADRTEFLGRNGGPGSPDAMSRVSLSGRTGAALDPCSAIQTILQLDPGQTGEVICLLGQAADEDEVRKLVSKYRHGPAVQESLDTTRQWWDEKLGRLQVQTPDPAVNIMLNRWLNYQTLSCRLWGRSAFYQSGGAFGFRDQLQDVLSLLYVDPGFARDHILKAASRQYREGDVQHWWHPPTGAGIRSLCSDDLLWLPYAVSEYVRFTGDTSILHERIRFIEGDLLDSEEVEVFQVPVTSLEQDTLYEHCRRAVKRGTTSGPHGLPLIGSGDWNDGMNRVGVGGTGESVWMAWFLSDVLDRFSELTVLAGQEKAAEKYKNQALNIARAAEESAWDGSWYRRAWYDDGTVIGSSKGSEAVIDSISQSWAVISGAGDRSRTEKALDSAWERLVLPEEMMALLLEPPFDKGEGDPGYIKGYPPGVRENGGQYSHAAMWLAKAYAMSGQGERAVKLLTWLNPVIHSDSPEGADIYKTEPYSVAADVYRLEGKVGHGGWTWYTGAAGWMYKVWIEDVLGLKVKGERFTVDPVISPAWDQFQLSYERRNVLYDIEVLNPEGVSTGVVKLEMDGRLMQDGYIPMKPDSSLRKQRIRHRVKVMMGKV